MIARLRGLFDRIDALSLRERVLLLVGVLVVLHSLADLLLFTPLEEQQTVYSRRFEEVQQQFQAAEQQMQVILAGAEQNPGRQAQARLDRMETQVQRLDRDLEAITATLISPARMVQLLEDLLNQRGDLELVRVQSMPPQPFLDEQDDATDNPPATDRVFHHGMELEFTGSYLAILDYLRTVQNLPWELFWDSLELRVETYPVTRVIITVHTLSLKEGWIGV